MYDNLLVRSLDEETYQFRRHLTPTKPMKIEKQNSPKRVFLKAKESEATLGIGIKTIGV